VGWVGGAGRSLGAALLALPGFRIGEGAGAGVDGSAECEIRELDGTGLQALNGALAMAGESDAAAALTFWYPLRGHGGVAALMAAREPAGALRAGDRAILRSAFSILGTAIAFATRTRRYARRLKQIQRARVAWELTVDALPQIVCVLDRDGAVIHANRAIETWGLGSGARPSFTGLHRLLHPGCGDAQCDLKSRLDLALSDWRVGEEQQFEHVDPRLGRALRVTLGCAAPWSGEQSDRDCTNRFAVIEDLAEERLSGRRAIRLNRELRRSLEQHNETLSATHEHLRVAASKLADTRAELEEMRRRHRLVLEHSDAGLLMVTEGQVSYCNARFEAVLGFAEGELQGARVEDLIGSGVLAPEILGGGSQQSTSPKKRVCEIKRRDGVSLWLWISEAGFDDGIGQQTWFITATDVTDQVVAEQVVLASRRKLQGLSRSLISSQEEERKRVAGELHDGVGQGLTLLKLMLQNLEADQMEPGAVDLPARLRVCIDKTQEMIEEVRRVSMALRPAILDSGGILLALKRLSREVGEMKRDLAVHLDIGVRESEIQGPLKIHLFRIVQEALNNVVRHAGAQNVWIRLDRSDLGLALKIEDDGVGFDPASLNGPASGLGLSSMKQRANLHHGVLRITSAPGQGTSLCVLWGEGCLDQSTPPVDRHQAQSDQSVVEGIGHQLGDVCEPHLAH
jgi:two-component system NarL family sensor kinase